MIPKIHLADFDNDGKCDILLVDKASGATTVIKNDYSDGKFSFTSLGQVTGSATCTEGYGRDKHDLGVRWHDIDADGMLQNPSLARSRLHVDNVALHAPADPM